MEHRSMSLILANRPIKRDEVSQESRTNTRGSEIDRPLQEECARKSRAFLIGILLPAGWSGPAELPT